VTVFVHVKLIKCSLESLSLNIGDRFLCLQEDIKSTPEKKKKRGAGPAPPRFGQKGGDITVNTAKAYKCLQWSILNRQLLQGVELGGEILG